MTKVVTGQLIDVSMYVPKKNIVETNKTTHPPAQTPNINADNPEPTDAPSHKKRVEYCDRQKLKVTAHMKEHPNDHAQRTELLKPLARQLKHLEDERSFRTKVARELGGVRNSIGISFGYNKPRKELQPYSRKQLSAAHPDPQKDVFDFIRRTIGAHHKKTTEQQRRIISPFHARTLTLESIHRPSDAEVAQRGSFAPVWAEVLAQIGAMKPKHQGTIISDIKACFIDLISQEAQDQRVRLTHAFDEVFVALAKALPDLIDAKDPSVISANQQEALALFKATTPEMTDAQKLKLVDELEAAAKLLKAQTTSLHPLLSEIRTLQHNLRNS